MQFFMLQLTCPINSPQGNCCFLVGPKDTYWNRVGEERQKNRFREPKRSASSSSLVTSPGSAMETPDKPATMATKELLCPSVMENAMQVVWDMEHDSGSRQPDLTSQLSCLHGPELHVGRCEDSRGRRGPREQDAKNVSQANWGRRTSSRPHAKLLAFRALPLRKGLVCQSPS